MSWVGSRTVRPWARKERIRSHSWRRECGSSPGVAPSRINRAGPPAGRGGQPLDELDGGGLAGPVGPEQAEALPDPHGQVQPADRLDGGTPLVALVEVTAADGRFHGRSLYGPGRAGSRCRGFRR